MESLAVNGGSKVRIKAWHNWPQFDQNEEKLLLEVLKSGEWWWCGALSKKISKVNEFEIKFAEYQSAKHCICVSTGTLALEAALRAVHVGCGDEVIVPPYTFVATATAVLSVGASPVFADIDPDTGLLDPKDAEQKITPRSKAIIPVHIAGCPCDMDGIMALAKKNNLRVVEDAAQAHGASWKNQRVGAIGDLGIFSFQASKNLNSGEGGAIVTNNQEHYENAWAVHHVGRFMGGGWYDHQILGSNMRMTEFQGAILLAQLERLTAMNAKRQANAEYLTKKLNEIDGISPLKIDPRVTEHAYHLYIFKYNSAKFGGKTRDEFIQALSAEGIPCSSGYKPLYKEPLFQKRGESVGLCAKGKVDYQNTFCPNCEQFCSEAVWLFQTLLLGDTSDMDDIVTAIGKIKQVLG